MLRLLLIDEGAPAGQGLSHQLGRVPALELVGPAATLEQARQLLGRTSVDLVLVDSHHGPDQFGLCRELRAITEAPVVILASFMTSQRWFEAKRAGVNAYLLREIDTARLVRELERIAGGVRPGNR